MSYIVNVNLKKMHYVIISTTNNSFLKKTMQMPLTLKYSSGKSAYGI